MSEVGLGLSYWLAQTRFSVSLAKRNIIERGPRGTCVRPVVDVEIAPGAIADPSSRQNLTIDSSHLEKLSLTINLDDRGFIESISSEANRGDSPVINFVGQRPTEGTTSVVTIPVPADSTAHLRLLDEEWASTNEHLAVHAKELEANIGRLLNELGQPDATPASILQNGQALELLQNQLGAISQVKRAWVSSQARELDSGVWQLTTSDLLLIEDTELPTDLVHVLVPEALTDVAERFGVLIAIADHERPEVAAPTAQDDKGTLVLRRSRPVTIGAYARDADGLWRLDEGSVLVMDIVDVFSANDYVALDGSWLRNKSFHLAYHPDMSLRTFGLTTIAKGTVKAPRHDKRSERAGDVKQLVAPRRSTDLLQDNRRAAGAAEVDQRLRGAV